MIPGLEGLDGMSQKVRHEFSLVWEGANSSDILRGEEGLSNKCYNAHMTRDRGFLIVIEGTDGAGKATQSQLLLRAWEKKREISFFDFPRYKQSNFGRLIRRSLSGEFGNFLELSPYLSSLPYMLDRARAKYLLLEALKEGDVICDRYTTSNLAHQGAKLPTKEQQEFIRFIEESEYKELGLPRPDLVIYLWIPSEVSQKLMKKRALGKTEKAIALDQHESKAEYQDNVVNVYRKLARSKGWCVIKCVDDNGKLLSRKDIHTKVVEAVQKKLKVKI